MWYCPYIRPRVQSGIEHQNEIQEISSAELSRLYTDFLEANKNELTHSWLRNCINTRQQTLDNDCNNDTLINSGIEEKRALLAELFDSAPEQTMDSVNRELDFLNSLRDESDLLAQATQARYRVLMERRDLDRNGTYARQLSKSSNPVDEFNPDLLGGTISLIGPGPNNLGAEFLELLIVQSINEY